MTVPWACARRAAKLPGTTASHSHGPLCAHLGLARGRGTLEGGGDGGPHLARKRCPGGEFPAETPSAWRPGEEEQAGSHISPAAIGLGQLGTLNPQNLPSNG